MQKNVVGIDIGFSAVKALNGEKILFPSVIGTPIAESGFSLRHNGQVIEMDGKRVPVGNTALSRSKYTASARTPDWVLSDTWKYLLTAALAETCMQPFQRVNVVTGLPVGDWKTYEEELYNLYKNRELVFTRQGRKEQRVLIEGFSVITQPFGSLLDYALDAQGNIVNTQYSLGTTAVCDIGGNTINLLVADRLETIGQWTESDELGLLHALDEVRDAIRSSYPRIRPETHEVSEWVTQGTFRYKGEEISMQPYIDSFLAPIVGIIVEKLNETWRESGRFDNVLFTGGGSQTLRTELETAFSGQFSKIAFGNRWTNVQGYLKYGIREF